MLKFSTHRSPAKIRRQTVNGIEYLIAPVVAIRAGVLNGVLVPPEALAASVLNWQGVPVPLGRHPQADGQFISANTPDQPALARFYNPQFVDNALRGEIWIDRLAALAAGGDAAEAVTRLERGEILETSTGYYADEQEASGILDGEPYLAVTVNLYPDHLAVLLHEPGACSVADGCGVLANSRQESDMDDEITQDGDALDETAEEAINELAANQNIIRHTLDKIWQALVGNKEEAVKETLIERLAANARCPLNQEQLETLEPDQLTALAFMVEPVEEPPAPAPEPAPDPEEDEAPPAWAQGLIDRVAAIEGQLTANERQSKAGLIERITAHSDFTGEELEGKPVAELEKLAKLVEPRQADYAGRGLPVANRQQGDVVLAMPELFPNGGAK